MDEQNQKGVSPVVALLAIVISTGLAGFIIKYASDSQSKADDEIIRQEELVSKSNINIIKKEAAKVQGGEADSGCASFFSEPTSQIKEIGLPVDCKLAVGNGFDNWRLLIQANQQSDQQFELEVHDGSGNLVQKIPVGEINNVAAAVTINGVNVNGDFINFANDINFDGYKDLRVLKFLAASNIIYDYWLFNPSAKKFERDPILTDVSNPIFDNSKKTISSYNASGFDHANWTFFKYEFINGAYQKTIVQ